MDTARLFSIRRTLFPSDPSAAPSDIPIAQPTMAPRTTFDPKTPRSPASLDSLGLKTSSQYESPGAFSDLLATIVGRNLGFSTAKAAQLAPDLRKFLVLNSVDNEATLAVMTSDMWRQPIMPATDSDSSPTLLAHVSPPVLAVLQKLQTAMAYAHEESRFLSAEVELSVLTGWSMAMSHLANPASSVMGVPAAASTPLPPGKPKSKDIPSFKIPSFNGTILKGDEYINDTADLFKSYGVHEYLVDEGKCVANKEFSEAFASRIRASIAKNDELKYIATTHAKVDNCAKLWKVLLDTLMSPKLSLSRECTLWKDLLDLRCEDVDQFPLFFSETVSKFHDLGRLNSVASGDDNFKRVFLHKNINVEELRYSTKKFLSDLNTSSDELLKNVRKDYSTLEASKSIKLDKPGTTLKANVRRADGSSKDATSNKKDVTFKGTYVTPFPKNHGNLIPEDIYKQVHSWYKIMAKRDKDASDEKFLKDFEFVDRRTKAEVASDKQSRKDAKIKKKNDSYRARNARNYDDYNRDYDRDRDRDRSRYHDDFPPPRTRHATSDRDYNRDRDRRDFDRGPEYGERDRQARANRARSRSSMMSGNQSSRYD